ncbi:MAG: sulfatase/phosphatase domain-containing protein, partial [Ruminiclostridium sp.]
PLFVRLPGGARSGDRIAALTQNIDIMPTVLDYHNCGIPKTVKGYSLLDITENKIKCREAVIFGWFGRAINICDGKYTYFRAPKNIDNQPLYNYCRIPTTIWRFYDNEYADSIEMGRFLPYTNYPVYKIPPKKNEDVSGDIKFVLNNELYDIDIDYTQQYPICDEKIESLLCEKLIKCMKDTECPLEQFERLGLK